MTAPTRSLRARPATFAAAAATAAGASAAASAAPTISVPPSAAAADARGLFARTTARSHGAAAPPPLAGPSVAVLCSAPRTQAAAASVALALAHATGRPFALAAAVGVTPAAPASLAPSARRAAARLRQRGEAAAAVGRTVWLASPSLDHDAETDAAGPDDGDRRDPVQAALADPDDAVLADSGPTDTRPLPADPAASVAEASAAVARAAQAVAAPAALAIPCARSAAVDRVLGWHDAIVVVREPDMTDEIADLILASLARLDRPAVAMPAPSRLAAHAAIAGLRPPASAIDAIARLLSAGAAR